MAAFSEKLEILYKFLYSVNFYVPLVHCEWGKKKKRFILCTASTDHIYDLHQYLLLARMLM